MGAVKRLLGFQKPPDVATGKTAPPTSADLEAVGRLAEEKVARVCKYVRLEMAKRMILLLAPIQFFGSKHSAGVDVYLDIEKAEQICSEVATALWICNDILAEMNLAPLGLAVEGHTSASIHGHTESLRISSLRANQCGKSIRRHLVEQGEGKTDESGAALGWGLPIDALVTQRGCGSTMPLPGFDDGGNHLENRRVEMRLLEPGQDGYCSQLSEVDGSGVKIAPKIKTRCNYAKPRSSGPQCRDAMRLREEAHMKAKLAAETGITRAEQRKVKAEVKELRAQARRMEQNVKAAASGHMKLETLRSAPCPVSVPAKASVPWVEQQMVAPSGTRVCSVPSSTRPTPKRHEVVATEGLPLSRVCLHL